MTIKLLTYNIDGLPESLDLRQLPWVLRPIAWAYRLVKGTYIVRVNDNDGVAGKVAEMSRRLADLKPDIIAVQEDFNYHRELLSGLTGYGSGSHTGDITFQNVRWLPYPRCKADGLGLLVRQDMVMMDDERIVPWHKSHGYFSHASDRLTQKGFRRYTVTVGDFVEIDVYVVHMDADFYHPILHPDVNKDVAARRAQLQQLTEYIIARYDEGNDRPTIIMGDTNCNYGYEWDKELVEYYLRLPLHVHRSLQVDEGEGKYNVGSVDRLFVVNNYRSRFWLRIKSSLPDKSFKGLSDHLPLVAEIDIEQRFKDLKD
jgi:endonuclease/exonuclease/phosphatase family metal-dependent hydrolase